MNRALCLFALLLVACSGSPAATGKVDNSLVAPPGFIFEELVTGLDQPTSFDFAPSGRMYIGEKGGRVRVFESGTLEATPFVDLRDEVLSMSDRGLESVAVHPQFPEQPFVYVFFIFDPFSRGEGAGPDSAAVPVTIVLVRRYTADAATDYRTAVPGSAVDILGGNGLAQIGAPACQDGSTFTRDCIPMDQNFHTGGMLKFAPDGSLFVSTGDGYENNMNPNKVRGLSLDSLAGKLLRVNALTGEGLADNPFHEDDLTSNRSRVYSLGLRNPWRFALSPFDGEPVIGDVGWDTWEEINTGKAKNFGWPCYEGAGVQPGWQSLDLPACQALYDAPGSVAAPLFAYHHDGEGASVILGDFYTGSAFPAEYHNALFFNDFNRTWIKVLTFDAQGENPVVHDFATDAGAIVQLSQGPDTNLYYARIDSGAIHRVRYTNSGNTPPVALLTAAPRAGLAPLEVSFSAAGSYDPDANELTYSWEFGDGETATGVTVAHSYAADGRFEAKLTVSDGTDQDDATTTILVGNAPPVATILTPAAATTFNAGATVTFSGEGSDTEDGALTGASLKWSGTMHHNEHIHYDALSATGDAGSFAFDDHEDNSWVELCLTATDSVGLTDTKCVDVRFAEVTYTFVTEPPGLELIYNGQRKATPFSVPMYVNAQRSIAAPEPQDGKVFASWSDSGERVHTITGAATDQTLTATFVVGTIPTSGLIHHWPFDSDLNDAVGDIDGTAHNGAWLADDLVRGSVLGCDGINDHVSFPNPLGATFSISAWVRSAQNSPGGTLGWEGNGLMWSDVGGQANDFTLAILNNRLAAYDGAAADGAFGTNGTTVLNDDLWHHIVVVRNGATQGTTLYVDGERDSSGVAGAVAPTDNPVLYFCGNLLDNRFFGGRLDDVRQYDRALTSTEAAILSIGPQFVPGDGPSHQWPLDADANDAIGTNHGALNNGAALTSDALHGDVLSCDGMNDQVALANRLPGTFSLSGWLRSTQDTPNGDFGWQGIGLIWSDVGGDANDFTLATLNDALAVFDGAAPGGSNATNGDTPINDGAWHHFAIVRDGGARALSIYVDGVLDVSGVAGAAAPNANPTLFFCGNVLDNRYYAGQLDDVQLFERVLSAEEIAVLAVPPPVPDAGVADAGGPVEDDAGAPDAGLDAAVPAEDASVPAQDASVPAEDASVAIPDASVPEADAGHDTSEDPSTGDDGDDGHHGKGSSCSVSHSAPARAPLALALVALAGLVRRRRHR